MTHMQWTSGQHESQGGSCATCFMQAIRLLVANLAGDEEAPPGGHAGDLLEHPHVASYLRHVLDERGESEIGKPA